MSEKVVVLLVRRDKSKLSPCQYQAIQALFPGRALDLPRTDPSSGAVHTTDCEERRASLVLLEDEPLPAEAMRRGFRHAVFVGDELKQLVGITPQFADLVPEANPSGLRKLAREFVTGEVS